MPQFYHDLITLNLCNMFKKDASFLLTKFQAKQSWKIAMSKNAGIIHRCDFCIQNTNFAHFAQKRLIEQITNQK